MVRLSVCGWLILLIIVPCFSQAPDKSLTAQTSKLFLHEGWSIQSSAQVKQKGEVLSQNGFQATKDWYSASVPSTVLGALLEHRVYPDPFFGMNLRLIPGCSYPIGANFSNRPMPQDSPFAVSWWYRKQFPLPASFGGRNIWLHFDGINFRANIWLNGQQIATSDEIAGTFRVYELNITELARLGDLNTLAVEVFPAQPDDLGWTWVDWNPMPPDKNMGIFRQVYLTTSGPVTLRYPQVITHFDLPSVDTAHLTVNVEVHNVTDRKLDGIVKGRIERIEFWQSLKLDPNETKTVTFKPDQFRQLNVRHPRVWWPAPLGRQNLYDLHLHFETGGGVSDQQTTRFGVREITSESDREHRLFRVNGRALLIRGGGWASDMLLRFDRNRLKTEFEYVKDMNLNTIRLEGQLQPDEFFDLADQYGILIIAGWCCCSHWEHWQHRPDYQEGPTWDKEDYAIAAASQADQIRRLRNHPSLLVWLNGSDNPPPPDVEQMYLDILKKYQWPNPVLSSATAKTTTVTGTTGVKMAGPYEWVPPSYWSLDTRLGGAHGFATEISPGPAVPPIESLGRMLPKDHLWPIDEYWNYHAGGGQFKDLRVFTAALEARYGLTSSAEDYARKSQLMAYEAQRAMFEAYGGNRYTSTGVIQWMLNNAWPSMIWHLYDYYLMTGGGYFGTKKACEPVHVQYSYGDKSVAAVNTTLQSLRNLKLIAEVYDLNLAERFTKTIELNLPAESNFKAFEVPSIPSLTPTYFLRLLLQNSQGQTISSNFYWLSTRDDLLDFQKSTWFYTPTTSYADMTSLRELKPTTVVVSGRTERRNGDETAHVTLSNPSKTLAFFIRLQIKKGRTGSDVLPIIWQDNYFSLLPGEKRDISAAYKVRALEKTRPFLKVEGWNVSPTLVPLATASKKD